MYLRDGNITAQPARASESKIYKHLNHYISLTYIVKLKDSRSVVTIFKARCDIPPLGI